MAWLPGFALLVMAQGILKIQLRRSSPRAAKSGYMALMHGLTAPAGAKNSKRFGA